MLVRIAAIVSFFATPVMASERLECFLTGSGYKNEVYPSGRKAVWYIDGTILRQTPSREMDDAPVPMATMKIVRRDEKVLIAEWNHDLPEGSSYRLVMDATTGSVSEQSIFRGRYQGADGSCKLVMGE